MNSFERQQLTDRINGETKHLVEDAMDYLTDDARDEWPDDYQTKAIVKALLAIERRLTWLPTCRGQ